MTLIGYEAKKLACHREIFLILIGLFVVAQVLFARSSLMIQSAVTKQYSQELGEAVSEDNTDFGLSYQVEQLTHYREYLDEYPDYIQTVLSQADQMEKVAVFQKQGSYAISNIQKTKSDFAKLDQVTLSDNAPLWIRNVLCWNNGIAILLVQVLVIVVVLFGAEQKNGIGKLWAAQYRGRKPVMAAKWSCLLIISFLLVVFSYAGFLIQARLQCEAGDLFAPIQSFEEFKRCSWKVNCLQMLIWNLIENWLIVFFIGSLFALFLSKIGVGFASVVLAALLAISWGLNKKLPETSFGLFFKEVNLYSFLYAEKRLRLYQNVNLFGRAIQNETCFIVSMLIGHPVLALCLRHAAGQERKEYRLGEKIGKWKFIARLRRTIENWKSEHASIVWHELYEAFGYQWRWLILVVFLLVGWYAIGQGDDGYYFLKKATYNSYIQTLQGAYTPEKEAFLQQEKAFLEGTDSTMEKLTAQLLDGSITQEEYEQEQIKIEREIDQKIDGFRIVEQQWRFIEEQKTNGVDHVGFFNQYLAEELFDKNPASLTSAVFLMIFSIVFLLGYQQIEYPCTGLIRVNFHGRGKQIRTKLAINIVIMVGMELFVSYQYYSGILSNYPACDFSINTSCIELLSQTAGNMSVGTFLLLKLLLGVIGAICLAVLISGIALLPQRPVVQYCLAGVLLGLPILFLKMGLPFATGGIAVFLCTDYLDVQLLPVGLVIWICYGVASFLFFFRTYQTAVRTKKNKAVMKAVVTMLRKKEKLTMPENEQTENPQLVLQEVSKVYSNGKRALNQMSMVLTPGIYGLLGPNGAGKSTLMQIISGNMLQSEGSVEWCGHTLEQLGDHYRKQVGFMPQQQELLEGFTGRQFLWYMASLKGMERKISKRKIEELLHVVNLEEKQDWKIERYSGGMKQRLLLAQALLDDPAILILDEPTAGLDPKERIRIRNYISKIAENKIVLIATHVVSDVDCIANQIIMMKNGELIKKEAPHQLLAMTKGYVWEKEVSQGELRRIKKSRISNLTIVGEGTYLVRVVAKRAPEGWRQANPTMEDVYLLYFAS